MPDGKPGRGADQFPLRLPDGMRDKLKQASKANSRSMNAEIVARLESAAYGAEEIAWLKREMERLREDRRRAELLARKKVEDDPVAFFAAALPAGLLQRIVQSAKRDNRTLLEEVVQALEKAYPVPDLTFGEHMNLLREALVDPQISADALLRPFFEALLRSYEKFAERDPEWVNKHPLFRTPPGSFPTNFRALEDQQE